MKDAQIEKLLEKAEVAKDTSRKDISLYEVDLRPCGYNSVITVHAKTKAEALAGAKKHVAERFNDPLTPDLPKAETK